MLNINLLLLDGAVLTLIFSAFVLSTLWWRPRLWLHGFPKDLQALLPPKTAVEKRLTHIIAIPFFGIVFGGLGWTTVRYGFDNGLFATMLHVYLVWQFINLFDLIVIDWGGMQLIDPQAPPFPETEGAKGYRDYTFHLKAFIKGSLLGLALAPVVVWSVWLLG